MSSDAPDRITLHAAAERLGVHYMTAYRRVRLGILPAEKIDGSWWIDPADLEPRGGTPPRRGRRSRDETTVRAPMWRERLMGRMLTGDAAGAWQVIEAAMASGLAPRDIYIDILAPTLHAIGAGWRSGGVAIEQEHLATSVATALIGRLGSRFVRRGRKKGVVIVAMPSGERHGLGVAMLADILTQDGFEVRNLGPDTPVGSLVAAMRDVDRLAAVIISVVDVARRPAAGRLLAAARREDPEVLLIAGGFAVPDVDAATALGADRWGADPRGLSALIASPGGRASRVSPSEG